jgi:hypothetical protein
VKKPEIRALCRLEEEVRAKQEAERRLKERMKKEMEDRGKADSVADAAFEFWTLMGDVWTELQHDEGETTNIHYELPATISPADSITVTTEFGVSEEPSNITTITSTAPFPTHDMFEMDHADEDDQGEEVLEPGAEDDTALSVSDDSTAAPPTPGSPELLPADLADDEGDEADLGDLEGDDENIDAESALIDEFFD